MRCLQRKLHRGRKIIFGCHENTNILVTFPVPCQKQLKEKKGLKFEAEKAFQQELEADGHSIVRRER